MRLLYISNTITTASIITLKYENNQSQRLLDFVLANKFYIEILCGYSFHWIIFNIIVNCNYKKKVTT